MLHRLLSAAVALALSLTADAHDFWIEPSSHAVGTNELVKLTLKVGDFAVGERVQRMDARIVDFSAYLGSARRAVIGRDGVDPAGIVRLESEGWCVLGYRSNHASVELEPAKFDAYLREKGLDHVLERRARQTQSSAKVREIYSRCAKSLVSVGPRPRTPCDVMLGYPLELIPEKNPSELRWLGEGDSRALETVPVRLFYDGKPLANALVGALDLDAPLQLSGAHQTPIEVRTDIDGRALLRLPRGGRWLLAAVHMIAAPDPNAADYESFWASLTLALPAK